MEQTDSSPTIPLPSVRKRRVRRWIIAAAVAVVAMSAWYFFYGDRIGYNEEKILDLGDKYAISWQYSYRMSADGASILLLLKTDKGQTIWKDGNFFPIEGIVEDEDLRISQDGRHFAYKVSNQKQQVFYDGKPSPEYDRVGGMVLSADGTQLAYSASRGKEHFLVLNGKEGPKFDSVFVAPSDYWHGDIIHPDDSNEVDDGEYGWEAPLYFYSYPGGKRFAYTAQKDGKKFVISDGKIGEKYDEIRLAPRFSPDEQHLAYPARKDGKEFMVVDGKEGRKYDHVGGPRFTGDGNHLVYIAKADGKAMIVIDDKEGPKYDGIIYPRVAPDGDRIAYLAVQDKKKFVVVDGVEGDRYDDIYEVMFRVDGKGLRYRAKNCGQSVFVRDGVIVADSNEDGYYEYFYKYRNGVYVSGVGLAAISPDNKAFAYSIPLEKGYIQKLWDKHVRKERSSPDFSGRIVFNGKSGPAYSWISHPVFRNDGTLVFYGIGGGVLYRVTKSP